MVIFGPLAQGLLLDKYDPEHPPQFGEGDIRATKSDFTTERLCELKAKLRLIKERFGSTIDDLVRVFLQYALARSKNACAILGFKNAAQVEINAAALGKPLTEEDIAFIRHTLRP